MHIWIYIILCVKYTTLAGRPYSFYSFYIHSEKEDVFYSLFSVCIAMKASVVH